MSGMTPAQMAQQLNRSHDGRYRLKRLSEAEISLQVGRRQEDSPPPRWDQVRSVTAARRAAAQLGISEQAVAETVSDPALHIPARNEAMWHMSEQANVLVGKDGVVLSVYPPGTVSEKDICPREDMYDLSSDAQRWAVRLGVDQDEIAETVCEPDTVQRGLRDCTWYTKGETTVLLAADDLVLQVRRNRPPRPDEVTRPIRRAPSGGHGWTPPADPRQFREMIAEAGFVSTMTGSGHYRVTHEDVPGASVIIPATPRQSGRWAKNSLGHIRRTFGIDPRPKDAR